jgi:hypothetical protein
MDETSKTSCNDSICKDISDGLLYMFTFSCP